jgi:MSHA biogenesis protein MshM
VRLLSNLETERNKLLQIVLFGQSELDELLQRPDLRQVNQRIGFSFTTGPLTVAEAVHYISHRVRTSRADGIEFPIFSERAMEVLAESACFVPRVINILADKALLVAYGEGAIQVTDRHAEVAIDDTPQLVRPIRMQRRWIRRLTTGVIAAEIAALLALLFFSPQVQGWAKEKIASAKMMLWPVSAGSQTSAQPSSLARSQ